MQIQLEKIRQADGEVRWQHEDDVTECNSCKKTFHSRKEKVRIKSNKQNCIFSQLRIKLFSLIFGWCIYVPWDFYFFLCVLLSIKYYLCFLILFFFQSHCSHCGRVFCAECNSKTIHSGPKNRAYKVCSVCHTLLDNQTACWFANEAPQSPT